MEVRRSTRLAAKRASTHFEEPKPKLEQRNGKILHDDGDDDVPPMIMLKPLLDNHSPFVNFVVHGLMKYKITDSNAEAVKKRVTDFYQMFIFFAAIKFVFWYLNVLQYK